MRKYGYFHYQVIYFAIIGIMATGVHYLFLSTLIKAFTLPALIANVIAYLIAFQISYYGHRYRTFSHQHPHPNKSYGRFIIASMTGLSLNETLFYFFSVQLNLSYTMAFLATAMMVIPMTFSAYKFWSFARN